MLIYTLLISLIFYACTEKNIPFQQNIRSNDLRDKDIYVTIRNKQINYVFDHFDKIISLIGNPITDNIIGGDENGHFSRAVFDGFHVDYYKESGNLRKIQIDKSSYPIISGVTIGNSRESVEKCLLNGVYIVDNNSYLFYKKTNNDDRSIGYEIYYDEKNTIKSIIITTIVFAP
jgi:hypothetical protein